MNWWTEFLNSLATRGGNIVVLALFSLLLLLVTLNLLLRSVGGEAVTVVITAFATFYGALIGVLTGGGSRQRANDPNGNGGKDAKP